MPIQKKIIIKDSSINNTTYNQLIKTKNINLKQEIDSYRRLVVQKPWGHEFVCCEMDNLSLLVLHIKNGHSTSLHALIIHQIMHHLRSAKFSTSYPSLPLHFR